MKILRRPVRFVSFLVLPVAALIALGACGEALETSAPAGKTTREGDSPALPSAGGTTTFSDAASPSKDETKHGLCGPVEECSPDNDGHDATDDCATAPDAGMGCHVTRANGTTVPRCGQADARGVDGVTCAKSSDCAPGFDCVEGEKGPICRRYCCSGSCEDQLSSNGGSTFCDVRKLGTADPHMIPVCMPIKSCVLLRTSDCGEKETCAVVNEKGATSCVPTGDAKVGESCVDTHCDANLNCLGSAGDRRCYKLCRVGGTDCAPMETCTTGSVFKDSSFGVCRKD